MWQVFVVVCGTVSGCAGLRVKVVVRPQHTIALLTASDLLASYATFQPHAVQFHVAAWAGVTPVPNDTDACRRAAAAVLVLCHYPKEATLWWRID